MYRFQAKDLSLCSSESRFNVHIYDLTVNVSVL